MRILPSLLSLAVVSTALGLSACSDFARMWDLMTGVGEIGTLADGRQQSTIALAEGITVPTVIGQQPRVSKPLPSLPMEDHPHLLDEYASAGVHGDSYNSSVSPLPGPLGLNPSAVYTPALPGDDLAMCTPLLRNHDDLLASVCIAIDGPSQLVLFDPKDDFNVLAQTDIPQRKSLTDPAGGWYTRLDNRGRPIVATPDQDVRVYDVIKEEGRYHWQVVETWDLRDHLPEGVSPLDVVPDWQGNYWFMTGYGHIGYINRQSGDIHAFELGDGEERFGTALAVTKESAFMLSTRALYRLEVDNDSRVHIRWRYAYGQSASTNGDLTAPTVFDHGKLVAFGLNDGRDRGRAMVLQTTAELITDNERVVCQHPVFKPGKSFLDNTMVGYGKSLVVQNNYGGVFYELLEYEPGLARVDVREDYSGCDTVWEEYTVSSQTPPRLSTGDGHVYQYSRRRGTGDDIHAWYLSAHDFETGKVASELFIASGERADNPMLSIDFLPGNVMVGGVRNGIVALRDNAEAGMEAEQ